MLAKQGYCKERATARPQPLELRGDVNLQLTSTAPTPDTLSLLPDRQQVGRVRRGGRQAAEGLPTYLPAGCGFAKLSQGWGRAPAGGSTLSKSSFPVLLGQTEMGAAQRFIRHRQSPSPELLA